MLRCRTNTITSQNKNIYMDGTKANSGNNNKIVYMRSLMCSTIPWTKMKINKCLLLKKFGIRSVVCDLSFLSSPSHLSGLWRVSTRAIVYRIVTVVGNGNAGEWNTRRMMGVCGRGWWTSVWWFIGNLFSIIYLYVDPIHPRGWFLWGCGENRLPPTMASGNRLLLQFHAFAKQIVFIPNVRRNHFSK